MIENIPDWKKTLMLAGLIDEWKAVMGEYTCVVSDSRGKSLFSFLLNESSRPYPSYSTLYDTQNMQYAWRLIEWAGRENSLVPPDKSVCHAMEDWLYDGAFLYGKPALAAQRAWLDKVLELAIEAGLVEVENG